MCGCLTHIIWILLIFELLLILAAQLLFLEWISSGICISMEGSEFLVIDSHKIKLNAVTEPTITTKESAT